MAAFMHICPVCQGIHEVPARLHQLAYSRQLTCSPRCKATLPRVVMARLSARPVQQIETPELAPA